MYTIFDTEFLDYILGVKVVRDLDEALAHIAAHSTHHSEAIITQDEASAERFCREVDSAAVYVNASTPVYRRRGVRAGLRDGDLDPEDRAPAARWGWRRSPPINM